MITLSRALARQMQPVFRRALGLKPKGPPPPVLFRAGPDGLHVQAVNAVATVDYHVRGRSEPEQIAAPFELLAACAGGRDEPVTLGADPQGTVTAQWSHRGGPRTERYEAPPVGELSFPGLPRKWSPNPPELLQALDHAMQTTDREASRYALGCVQLRGRLGVIGATDGRQLLVQSGWRFDWRGDLLVPRNSVFACRELPRDQTVRVGRSDGWFVVRVGDWTIALALRQEGRFPRVEEVIAHPDTAQATLQLSESDAQFLAQALPQLPGDADPDRPVTMDLDSPPAVRARAGDQPPTEIVLRGARCSGVPVRLNSNRGFLERAVRLGFRTLHVFDPEAPLQCRDERRRYLWMPLSREDAVLPSPQAVRVESPAGACPAPQPSTPPRAERRPTPMPRDTPHANGRNGHDRDRNSRSPGPEDRPPATVEEIVRQAEAVREVLRRAHQHVSLLIAGLRQHRKQSRLVRTTLASLKHLQNLDA